MPNLHRIAFTTLIASLFFTAPSLFAEEAAKAEEPPAPVIVGNPPADHPFGKLKIGMTYRRPDHGPARMLTFHTVHPIVGKTIPRIAF